MTQSPLKPQYTEIPVKLSKNEFNEFILPHLSMPKRGPRGEIGYFNKLDA